MEIDFNGKVIIVTGSGRGIGREIAESFTKNGATVIISDYSTESLIETENLFTTKGYSFKAIPCDVTNSEDVQNLIDLTYKEFGKIDVLINNAGITKDNLILRMKDEQWDSVIETNLKGVFLTTRASVKYFLKQRYGKIINISSVVGITGNIGQSNYSASKAGIIGFSKSIARELAIRNITVNIVAPGFIDTPMTSVLPDGVKEDFIKKIPLKRMGTPTDIANIVLFIASPLADYITGQVINVDGGMVM
ncbi:MAG: 3-oxoacyl-[acyl-carrier-protein] reductase [Candidatus Marinimicrobia bacterium]|nr:3-oxoacyl-[acyl-carrier-protein] reductase [Candidatus Neomarinimicrobiota bacterium]